jgi:hypothetical protein
MDDDQFLSLTPFNARKNTGTPTAFLNRDNGTTAGGLGAISTGFTLDGVREDFSNWTPMYYMYSWEEFGSLNPYLNVCLSLPSGLTYDGSIRSKLEAKISESGRKLIVNCMWPTLLCDPLIMKEGFRGVLHDSKSLQTMIHAASMALAKHRKSMGFSRGQSMFSTAVIDLPEEVEANFPEPVPIQDEYGGAVLIIILRMRKESMEAPEHDMVVRKVHRSKKEDFGPQKKKHKVLPLVKTFSPEQVQRISQLLSDSEDDEESCANIVGV